jgi:GTPase
MPKTAPKLSSPHPSSQALLVARPGLDDTEADVRASLLELEQLLAGLGTAVVDTFIARRGATTHDAVGRGKIEDIRARLAPLIDAPDLHETVLVFDGSLDPTQQRRLEDALDIVVLDRTGVILRVFEQRAQTDMARLEIELARLGYEAPRVREDRALTDREGGGGGRGERGHTNVELRKQQLRARMRDLRSELERLRTTRAVQRARRKDLPHVALVGYTNAGKSSIMRALTHGEIGVEDRLFSTLGTTVRVLMPEASSRILVSDTVGFIRNLPHELVASFHSTLEEVRDADLLLHVVDASDPRWPDHMEVTRATLVAIGATQVPSRVVLNKIDRVDPESRTDLAQRMPEALQVSAHHPEDMRQLRDAVVESVNGPACDEALVVPIGNARLIAEIRGHAEVLGEHYCETHARLQVRASPKALSRWAAELRPLRSIDTVADVLAIAQLHGLELETEVEEFDSTGLDFLVAHAREADGTPWIVRTPRRPDVSDTARIEARVLRLVAPHLCVAVPSWRVHAHDLIAYPRLPGHPVVTVSSAGEVSWQIVDPDHPSESFIESLARALVTLQGIGAKEVIAAALPVTTIEQVRQELARDMAQTRSVLEPSDATWSRWQRWLDDRDAWPTHLALVHGDLHPGHTLVDDSGRLTGIIDWTEATLTDPSVDFAMFFGCFGREATVELVRRFEHAGGRTWPGLIEHAAERWAFFPVLGAAWSSRTGSQAALHHARAQLATLESG